MENILNKEDAYIIELERKIRHYQSLTVACNNQEPQCTNYHNKAMALSREQSKLIFDNSGMFRKDKRHLLPWLEGDASKEHQTA